MRGLLMVEPLYHQTIAGNKTMTRRSGGLDAVNSDPDNWALQCVRNGCAHFMWMKDSTELAICSIRYALGEVLYIKEPLFKTTLTNELVYMYDQNNQVREAFKGQWQNKLFMPASAARVFVKITSIKCERLLDISDTDCIAEGIELVDDIFKTYLDYENKGFQATAKRSFISLYRFANKISAKKEIANLWVWVYSFEYLKNYKNGIS